MHIEQTTKNDYTHLSIIEPLTITTNISNLVRLVRELLDSGAPHLTLSFPTDSFLSSTSLAKLIVCGDMTRVAGGSFTLISPNDQVLGVIRLFDLANVMRTARSIDELPQPEEIAEMSTNPVASLP